MGRNLQTKNRTRSRVFACSQSFSPQIAYKSKGRMVTTVESIRQHPAQEFKISITEGSRETLGAFKCSVPRSTVTCVLVRHFRQAKRGMLRKITFLWSLLHQCHEKQ